MTLGVYIFIASAVLFTIVAFSLFIWGFEVGVKDTERRWADAVGRNRE